MTVRTVIFIPERYYLQEISTASVELKMQEIILRAKEGSWK